MNISQILTAPISHASLQHFTEFMSGGAFLIPLAILGAALLIDASWRVYLFIATAALSLSAFYPSPEGKALTLVAAILVIIGVYAYNAYKRHTEMAGVPEHMRGLDWDTLDRKLLN
jgi:hypothetical protein|tara:strand:+ start:1584 stop:1931 length:348 start_codon:yes stop_codon:yes gene_type:complete